MRNRLPSSARRGLRHLAQDEHDLHPLLHQHIGPPLQRRPASSWPPCLRVSVVKSLPPILATMSAYAIAPRVDRRTGRAGRGRPPPPARLAGTVRQRPPRRAGNRHGQGDVPDRAGQGPAGRELLRHRVGPLVLAVRQRPPPPATAAPTPARSGPRPGTSSASSSRRTACRSCTSTSPTPGPRPATTSGGSSSRSSSRTMARVLAPGGRLQVVTDHKGYFEENIEPTVRASGADGRRLQPPRLGRRGRVRRHQLRAEVPRAKAGRSTPSRP